MKKVIINATLVALFLLSIILIPLSNSKQIVANASSQQFTQRITPGFQIWEDPNTPNYYAYDATGLNGKTQRYHFHKDQYSNDIAFVRLGLPKPTVDPVSGTHFDPSKLRLIEVRPYNHDAFYPSDVSVDQNDSRVLININGISFTRTPYKDIYNPGSKGTWDYGTIYSENHHIPLELVWEYADENEPETKSCPPSGVQTSVTEESGRRYYSCNCDENGCDTCVEIYYETAEMEVVGPTPDVVQAGQGTEFKVITRYSNDNPNHEDRPYAAGEVQIEGTISDNYPSLENKTVNMISDSDDPPTDWPGRVDWELPYAMIDKDGNWTMTESESEAQNYVNSSPYNFGGYQRWYFGFDVPDGEEFEFVFQTDSHGYNNITLCDKRTVTIEGTPYDDFIIRTVDPNNPFPTGEVGINWQGNEHLITDLKDWYNEPQEKYKAKVEAINAANIFQNVKSKLTEMFNLGE